MTLMCVCVFFFWPKYAPAVFAVYVRRYLYHLFEAPLSLVIGFDICFQMLIYSMCSGDKMAWVEKNWVFKTPHHPAPHVAAFIHCLVTAELTVD